MILSMTGYGEAVATFGRKTIHAEVKTLNSKTLDLSMRIAPAYREKEMELRQMIAASVERGKVEFSIWIEKEEGDEASVVNTALLAGYYQQVKALAADQGIPEPADWMATLLRLPDAVGKPKCEQLDDEEWAVARQAAAEALERLADYRRQEGLALQAKFEEKLSNIETLQQRLEPYEQERVGKIRQRITDALAQIPEAAYDENRLEQELIYYIEKLDISEEKQRLTQHLRYFRETMQEQGHGVGKKLGFIAQEMGREINTTGSKSNHSEMQNIVVQMKDELEQIKEQVLNAL